jgi:hypothetical protein
VVGYVSHIFEQPHIKGSHLAAMKSVCYKYSISQQVQTCPVWCARGCRDYLSLLPYLLILVWQVLPARGQL